MLRGYSNSLPGYPQNKNHSIRKMYLCSKGSKYEQKGPGSACASATIATVQILCIGTDGSQQTVQTKIRLLLKKQSDQGLRCLLFHQHLLDALMQCYIKRFYF